MNEIRSLDELASKYRIRYIAPGDVRCMGLESRSVDFIYSTSVLEHIPMCSLEPILAECSRICSTNAIMSFLIDYTDHYAATDPTIGWFNFYRYFEPFLALVQSVESLPEPPAPR